MGFAGSPRLGRRDFVSPYGQFAVLYLVGVCSPRLRVAGAGRAVLSWLECTVRPASSRSSPGLGDVPAVHGLMPFLRAGLR